MGAKHFRITLAAATWISIAVHAQSPARKPVTFAIKSSSCPLEYKPMTTPKAPWQKYPQTLPVGTNVQGFLDAKNADLYSFRAVSPKNLFFRGSLACLSGPQTTAVETRKKPQPQPPSQPQQQQPAAPPSHKRLTSYNDSGLILGFSYWKGAHVMDATSASAADEDIAATYMTGNLGYNFQFYRGGRSSFGTQIYLTGGIATVRNATTNHQIKFSGSALIGGAVLKPTYYFNMRFLEIGPLVSFTALYGIFQETTLGVISDPFQFTPVFGLSLKIPEHGHTLDIGAANFNFSKYFIALNFAI